MYIYYVCVLNNCIQCEQQTLRYIGADPILPHLRASDLKARPESLNQQAIFVVSS